MNAQAQFPGIDDDDAVAALRQLLRQRRLQEEQAPLAPSPGNPASATATSPVRAPGQHRAASESPANYFVPGPTVRQSSTAQPRNRWLSTTPVPPTAHRPAPADHAAATSTSAKRQIARPPVRVWPLMLATLVFSGLVSAYLYFPEEAARFATDVKNRALLAWEEVLPEDKAPAVKALDLEPQRSEVLALRAENTALRDRLAAIEARLSAAKEP